MAIKKYLSLEKLAEYDALIKQEIVNSVSGKANTNHNHDGVYEAKGSANSALSSAKTYADTVASKVKSDLLNGAGTAYDTLKELGDLIDTNVGAIEALETVAAGKADKSHTHKVENIVDLTATVTELNYVDGVTSNIQTQLDGKASFSHGHSDASTSASGFMTSTMVTKLNGIATGANKTTVDSSLSTTSTNPLQNKVVANALNSATTAINTNASGISANSTAIASLQTEMDNIVEITSEEITALFNT